LKEKLLVTIIIAAASATAATIAQAKHVGPWGPAANAESIPGTSSELNTASTDGCPHESVNGRTLYFASNRPGGLGGLDIMVATRSSKHAPWGAPVNLGAPVNSAADDFCPTPTKSGHLYFVSAGHGGCGSSDIFVTRRRSGAWSAPVNLGCQVNSSAAEASPSLVKERRYRALYFSSTRDGGDMDIYRSAKRRNGSFGTAAQVVELNTALEDARPNVRHDGREIVFDSNRAGTLGLQDIYASTRRHVGDTWSTPVNLGLNVNSPSNELRATLSWDGRTLMFGSNRPGSEGGSLDLYLTTRRHGGP
jgi:Tol biopolymer transport system component